MILVSGSNGQLGLELCRLLTEKHIDYIGKDKSELDITDKKKVNQTLLELKPTVIFHCAAYTAVDAAEDEGKEANYLINEVGSQNIAEAAKKINAKVVYISTDYVFDGSNVEGGYKETDLVDPINEYGKAKLLGEKAIQENLDDYYIIRTSWVFGQYGKNFVFTMLNLSETHEKLTVVNDQFGRPTWTRSLAEFMLYLVENNCDYGTYHFSNDETCTWYDFAQEILKDKKTNVEPVTSDKFPQKATRPEYSVMNLEKAKSTGFQIISWKQALAEMLSQEKL
ncbi:dTDP-4-dehydrorhamnose reductase [Vagococcus carniphilus]|uniref:dTDP-4-dehydrorhamnose reductase n=1 Tax=Vagococcus carniphilus TaxID=218144 RepID=A0AAW8U8I8_9ENTE|nr:dTDP-4-dehydrorhamnose reductase [Vagococcus carniphilus]MDT2833537.1 dTDP-4-dehydrorhamnose reductase [Vagococcus carniphilus]